MLVAAEAPDLFERPFTRRAASLGLLLLEGQRAWLEGMASMAAAPLLERAPRGDGHPVLVLPGLGADDRSTAPLRAYLRRQGWESHPWLLGRNFGSPGPLRQGLLERVRELHSRTGAKLSLIGWSLGGIYARELAKALPACIRRVITLGSPFGDLDRPMPLSPWLGWLAGRPAHVSPERIEQLRAAPPVPSTAIYSRTDGIVNWRVCRETEGGLTENVEVPGSHCGLGQNPLVLYVVADRLAQQEGAFEPFHREGWRRLFYR